METLIAKNNEGIFHLDSHLSKLLNSYKGVENENRDSLESSFKNPEQNMRKGEIIKKIVRKEIIEQKEENIEILSIEKILRSFGEVKSKISKLRKDYVLTKGKLKKKERKRISKKIIELEREQSKSIKDLKLTVETMEHDLKRVNQSKLVESRRVKEIKKIEESISIEYKKIEDDISKCSKRIEEIVKSIKKTREKNNKKENFKKENKEEIDNLQKLIEKNKELIDQQIQKRKQISESSKKWTFTNLVLLIVIILAYLIFGDFFLKILNI